MTIREELIVAIREATSSGVPFVVEYQEDQTKGHYSTNAALTAGKSLGKNPREVAETLAGDLKHSLGALVERVEIAGPGFLNIFLNTTALATRVSEYSFVPRTLSHPEKILLEYVSANPTGPLTIGNGRGGFLGDTLARIYTFVGHTAEREFYINDTGRQINILGASILTGTDGYASPNYPSEELYQGAYIKDLRALYIEGGGSVQSESPEETVGRWAAEQMMEQNKKALTSFSISHDRFISERDDLKDAQYQEVYEWFSKAGLLHEKDGAIWYGRTEPERVLVRSDGNENVRTLVIDGKKVRRSVTYLFSDIVYHYDKLVTRAYDRCINILGADHHGYISALMRALEDAKLPIEKLTVLITQLVRIVENGVEVKVSKRKGSIITLGDLVEDVGVDVARWFFLSRSIDTHMDFNLTLAREKSKNNPVYYVQYAHARAAAILTKAQGQHTSGDITALTSESETKLVRRILQLDEVLADTLKNLGAQRLTQYTYELARDFTTFYETDRVIGDDTVLTASRLRLVAITKTALATALGLMGISTPEKM